jgi:hypothetical protein
MRLNYKNIEPSRVQSLYIFVPAMPSSEQLLTFHDAHDKTRDCSVIGHLVKSPGEANGLNDLQRSPHMRIQMLRL